MRFRTLVFALLLAGFAGAYALATDSAPTIRVAIPPNDSAAEAYYAADMGFFKNAGINVQLITVNNAGAISSSVAGGAADIGNLTISSLAAAHEHGLPFTIVAPGALYSDKGITSALVVRQDSPIRTGKDLEGKTVGVRDLSNLGYVATLAWVEKTGGDPNAVKFIETSDAAAAAALEQGRIAAAALSEPELGQLVRASTEARILAPYTSIAKDFMTSAYFATAQYAKDHHDVMRRFESAIVETARWANRHQSDSANILAKYSKIDMAPSMARVVYAERLNPAQIQPMIDAAARYGLLKSRFAAADLIDEDGEK